MTPQERQRLTNEWLNQSQQRFWRDSDGMMGVRNHQASMIERNFAMYRQQVQLAIEITNAKLGFVQKAIQNAKAGHELQKMREARTAWKRELGARQRELKAFQKRAGRLLEHADNAERLIWGTLVLGSQVARAWQGFFVCAKQLPFSSKAKLSSMKISAAAMSEELYFPKSGKERVIEPTLKVRGALSFFHQCRIRKAVPIEGSECHKSLVECLAAIDKAAAASGAAIEIKVAGLKEEIGTLRAGLWQSGGWS